MSILSIFASQVLTPPEYAFYVFYTWYAPLIEKPFQSYFAYPDLYHQQADPLRRFVTKMMQFSRRYECYIIEGMASASLHYLFSHSAFNFSARQAFISLFRKRKFDEFELWFVLISINVQFRLWTFIHPVTFFVALSAILSPFTSMCAGIHYSPKSIF